MTCPRSLGFEPENHWREIPETPGRGAARTTRSRLQACLPAPPHVPGTRPPRELHGTGLTARARCGGLPKWVKPACPFVAQVLHLQARPLLSCSPAFHLNCSEQQAQEAGGQKDQRITGLTEAWFSDLLLDTECKLVKLGQLHQPH